MQSCYILSSPNMRSTILRFLKKKWKVAGRPRSHQGGVPRPHFVHGYVFRCRTTSLRWCIRSSSATRKKRTGLLPAHFQVEETLRRHAHSSWHEHLTVQEVSGKALDARHVYLIYFLANPPKFKLWTHHFLRHWMNHLEGIEQFWETRPHLGDGFRTYFLKTLLEEMIHFDKTFFKWDWNHHLAQHCQSRVISRLKWICTWTHTENSTTTKAHPPRWFNSWPGLIPQLEVTDSPFRGSRFQHPPKTPQRLAREPCTRTPSSGTLPYRHGAQLLRWSVSAQLGRRYLEDHPI